MTTTGIGAGPGDGPGTPTEAFRLARGAAGYEADRRDGIVLHQRPTELPGTLRLASVADESGMSPFTLSLAFSLSRL